MEKARSKTRRRCPAVFPMLALLAVCVLLLAGCAARSKDGGGLENAA